MGFFLQLKILLWKNITLKRRSPLVVLMEVFIPLVLFVILLLIRKNEPARPDGPDHFKANPLPSAGVTSIMQSFCDGGTYDRQGFQHFQNATVFQLLENFQNAAEHNNFFTPRFSADELDRLPDLYRSIIDDPATLHDKFIHAKSIRLKSLFVNQTQLAGILEKNFNISKQNVHTLYNSRVNFTEVYRVLFGAIYTQGQASRYPFSHARHRRDVLRWQSQKDRQAHSRWSLKEPTTPSANILPDLINSANDVLPELVNNPQLNDWASVLSPGGSTGSSDPSDGLILWLLSNHPEWLMQPEVRQVVEEMMGFNDGEVDSYLLADVLKKFLLSPESLHYLACESSELDHILIPPDNETYESPKELGLCNMTATQWQLLSDVLINYTSTAQLVKELQLEDTNFTAAAIKVRTFSKNLAEFMEFERNLVVLSTIASKLPQDACKVRGNTTGTPTAFPPTTGGNDTASTIGPPEDDSDDSGELAGLLRIWLELQKTVCGKDSSMNNEKLDKFHESQKLGDLGLSSKQQQEIGILIHVLYSNPRVLYSPNNTQASRIITKANGTFALIDHISEYARRWLNVSAELRAYLSENSTEHNLDTIREMQVQLRGMPTLLKLLNDPVITAFAQNTTVPNTTFFLNQLDEVDNAACSWLHLLKDISLNVFKGFANERDLENYFLRHAQKDNVTVFASVVFMNIESNTSLPAHVIYKIRQNATFTEDTKSVRDRYWHPGPRHGNRYYRFGFAWIQDMMERAIIDIQAQRDVVEPGTYIQNMPYPCYMDDEFLFMIEHVMPLCLTISWVYTVAMLVQSIVYEKEQRLKEVMRMMGLTNSVHWLAWFLTTFCQMSITMITLTLMLKFGHVLYHSNILIIFLVLEVFAIATIAFSFLVSVWYSKAKIAAACAGIVYFLSYVPYMYLAIREDIAGDNISAWTKSLASLFSTTAFGLGAKYFAFYEIEGVGVQWENFQSSPVEDDQYSLFHVTVMMVFDALLYGLLTWYIENIHPGSYGLPKPWYFPLTKSYWCGHPRTEAHQCSWRMCCQGGDALSVMEEDQACALLANDGVERCEPEPAHLPLGVCIDNLTKIYKNGKLAVNKLSLNLYEGQITSFLGHNGAGKTTTMSILTGLFPPSQGTASIYGLDIRSDMEEIRKSLGMCPQHNVLFDKFTVEEHMWFYARLKGMECDDIKAETDRMIDDIGLPNKRHNTVDCLSGGMKRKLSVAIAFVGGSRTVILDEPTAGVDPYARRAIWDLIFQYKQDRTILLSTHHMDEADILGDRIAIISHGQLKCCGSSLHLKSTFGKGYHLTLVKKGSEEDLRSTDTLSLDGAASFNTRCSERRVSAFIKRYVPTAYCTGESSQQLHYILPFDEAKKGHYERLFQAMNTHMAEIDVSSYGLADTNLEEVFLKVTEDALNEDDEDGTKKKKVPTATLR